MSDMHTRELWQRIAREGPRTADYEWCVFEVYEGRAYWYEQEASAREHLLTGKTQFEHGVLAVADPQGRTEADRG